MVAGKGGVHREGKRNMSTSFTQRDVLKILGEGQDVRAPGLNHVKEDEHEEEQMVNAVGTQEWYIDTASNRQVVGDKLYFIRYRELSSDESTVRGIAPRFKEQPVGVETILLKMSVAGNTVHNVIGNMLVSGASNPLLSMGRALNDGFKFEWDSNAH